MNILLFQKFASLGDQTFHWVKIWKILDQNKSSTFENDLI